jgi:hypothetical protein
MNASDYIRIIDLTTSEECKSVEVTQYEVTELSKLPNWVTEITRDLSAADVLPSECTNSFVRTFC